MVAAQGHARVPARSVTRVPCATHSDGDGEPGCVRADHAHRRRTPRTPRRVTWAAIRLHHGIRDALNHIDGTPSDRPFDLTLGQAVGEPRDKAKQLSPVDREALGGWVSSVKSAVDARNGVIHAIPYTADDGHQALRGSAAERPNRYTAETLLRIAGELAIAARDLPRRPHEPAATT